MAAAASARWWLEQECRALLTRLDRLDYFAVIEPMVAAAAPEVHARVRIERYLFEDRVRLRRLITSHLTALYAAKPDTGAAELQRRFAFVRLRFNALLADFDTFSDVMTQRSEAPFGVWLAGLDVAAASALEMPDSGISVPPVVCYLDRGHGAAIRRARTRLSTGGENPVAIIRIPRERMVGSGIAASLFHEAGHQAAEMMNLLVSLRQVLWAKQLLAGPERIAWALWERWISEIAADFWAMAHLGVGATLGVFGVLSLPGAFVFRIDTDDPHPFPWLRAVLSCRLGAALFPDPQWNRLETMWRSLYPLEGLDARRLELIRTLETTMPEFVGLLVNHRVRAVGGRTIPGLLQSGSRSPEQLRAHFQRWRAARSGMLHAPPALALAALGQAKADSSLSPEGESKLVLALLRSWALQRCLSLPGPIQPRCNCRRKSSSSK
ncbi:MAG: hypothetical protein J0H49_03580 [Acidobacteria bacterium]|nr:hypothetical protein [Acidobacteriota bacterium]